MAKKPLLKKKDPRLVPGQYLPPVIPAANPYGIRKMPIPPVPKKAWVPGTPATAGTAGYTPDYAALMKASPEYQTWLASAAGRNIGSANTRAGMIRQLLLQYGGVPPDWQDAYGDIRPEDVAAAQGNQFGTQQMIARTSAQNVNQMRRALAARGMLQTGELNYGQGQEDLRRGGEEYGALTDFLGKVGGAVGDYTGNVAGVAAEEAPLIGQLMPTIRDLYPTTPGTPGTPATEGHWAKPFLWGGRSWGAGQQRQFESWAAKNSNLNLKLWYKNHPAAAKLLGVKGY